MDNENKDQVNPVSQTTSDFYQTARIENQNLNINSTPLPDVGMLDGTPTGVKVIVALTLISAMFNFFNSQSSDLSTSSGPLLFGLIISFAISIWLLTLSNVARIIFIILSTLIVINSFMAFFQLIDIQKAINTNKQKAEANISALEDKSTLTQTEQQSLTKYEEGLNTYNNVKASDYAQFYMMYIFSIVYSSWVIFYLLRPSVKQRFE